MEVDAVANWRDKQTFEVECSRPDLLISANLRQMRSKADMSLRDVAAQLGIKSMNAYARFETTCPPVTKPSLGLSLGFRKYSTRVPSPQIAQKKHYGS